MRTRCWLWVILLSGVGAFAQEFRASISGTITDSSGSVVPRVTVVATHVASNVKNHATSNEAGRYVISFLVPGTYTVTVEHTGFKKFVRENLLLGLSDRYALDITLQVGQVTESVTVSDQVSLLQTETATRVNFVERNLIEKVPNNGRNPYLLTHSLPGVIKTGYWGSAELYAYGQVSGVSISGGRSGENETVIDGVSDTRTGRSVSFIPAIDTLSEISVQTNVYDAQFSRTGGGVNVFASKTGTNKLHGALYEHLKHEKLNALGFINAKSLAEYRAANPGAPEPNLKFRNNTFGFALDGPVYLPKLVDGRNKMFFLISMEGLEERHPSGQKVTLPLAEQLNGDFSGLFNANNQQVLLYDPLTTDSSSGLRTPFGGNRLPANRISAVASNIAKMLPAPNSPGLGPAKVENYISTLNSPNSYYQWIGKLDYRINDKNNVFFRRGETPWENFAQVVWGTNAAEPSGEAPSTRRAINWGADWTSTLTPTIVFNLRGGLARNEDLSGNIYGVGYNPSQLGFDSRLVSQFDFFQFPRIALGTYTNIGTPAPSQSFNDTWSLQPNINWVKAKHVLKIGTEFRLYNENNINPGFGSGNYSFAKNWSQRNARQADATSGNEFASFLLGYPASGSVDKNVNPAFSWRYYSAFLQDDWKLNHKLTLNIGFRWDYEAPLTERFNRQVRSFAFDQPATIASQVQGLTLKGGIVYAGTSGESRQAFNRDLNNFQPRAGIAYKITDKLVFRGGYGLAYLGQNARGPLTGFNRSTSIVASVDGGLTPRVTFTNAFPEGLLLPIGKTLGLATDLGLGVSFQYLNRGLPYTHQFSAGFQYELPFGIRADLSYVGNITKSLPLSVGYNYIPLSELGKPQTYYSERLPNPMAGLLPNNAAKNGATITRDNLLLPYPHFGGVTAQGVPIGKSRYDAMQSSFVRRFANGFSLNVNFTISKNLEQVSLLNAQDFNRADPSRTRLEKRLVEWDAPTHLGVMWSYDFPVGKGRKHLARMPYVADFFLGGWNFGGNYNRRAGPPLDFPNAPPLAARSARLSVAQRDELAKQYGQQKWDLSYVPYFEISLFPRQTPPPNTYRDWPTRFPDIRGFGLNNVDFNLRKEFPVGDSGLRFEYRAEFLNAFNSTYFRRLDSNGANVTHARFGFIRQDATVDGRIIVMVLRATF